MGALNPINLMAGIGIVVVVIYKQGAWRLDDYLGPAPGPALRIAGQQIEIRVLMSH